MLRQANPWRSYQKIATQTASPGQLVLQLYDGILRFLEQARVGFTLDDPKEFNEAINNNIQRAQAIIHELDAALNMDAGGEFAATMRRLYDYFDRLLQESNMTKSITGVEEVLRHVNGLRDSWKEMLLGGGADAEGRTASVATPASLKSP